MIYKALLVECLSMLKVGKTQNRQSASLLVADLPHAPGRSAVFLESEYECIDFQRSFWFDKSHNGCITGP